MIFFGLIQMIFFDNNFLSGVKTITFESEIKGGVRGGGGVGIVKVGGKIPKN